MSNTLIDLEGLKVFYTKILTEDLAEYARYDSLSPAIVAPTLVGEAHVIVITNNDSRPLTFYYGQEENIDKDDSSSFEGSIKIDADESTTCITKTCGIYYVKVYTDDGAESPIYTVEVAPANNGGSND